MFFFVFSAIRAGRPRVFSKRTMLDRGKGGSKSLFLLGRL